MSKAQIKELAERLQIPFLLHFTRAENIPSIMQHGLYPVSRVGEVCNAPLINDHLRLDGHLNGTSTSIAFPNSRMFFKYRNENPGQAWAVLALHPSLLWLKECAFCKYNAADIRISAQPLCNLQTFSAFEGLFAESEPPSRVVEKLKAYDPTQDQAEVMILDIIEPQLIAGAVYDNAAIKDQYAPHMGDRPQYVNRPNKNIFAQRRYARLYG